MNKSIIDSITYIFSNALNAAIPFILLPFLVYFLSPAEYGRIAIFQTFTFGLFSLVGLNCYAAANRAYFDDASSEYKVRFNTACIQLPFIASVVVGIVLYVVYSFFDISYILEGSLVWLALISSLSLNYIYLRLGQWQVREEPRKFVKFFLGKLVAEVTISVALILLIKSAEGRIYAVVIVNLFFSLISVGLLNKDLLLTKNLFSFDKIATVDALKFGVPLIPHFLGIVLLTSVDRVVIAKYMTLKDVGVYMVAMQIGNGVLLLLDGVNKVAMPLFSQKLAKNDADENKSVVRIIYHSMLAISVLSVLLYFVAPLISDAVSVGEYKRITQVIGVLVLAQCIGGASIFMSNIILYYKDTFLLSGVTVFAGVFHVLFSVAVIEDYGLKGVAVSFLISKFICLILIGFLSIRKYQLPWFFYKGVKYDV